MILFLISLLFIFVYFFIKNKKVLHMLQQNRYNEDNRYLKWMNNNVKLIFINSNLSYLFIFFICLLFEQKTISIIVSVFYLVLAYIDYKKSKKEQVKKPLVVTARVKRLFVTTILIYALYVLLIIKFYVPTYLNYYYFILGTLIYFNYFVVFAANIINKPVEKCVYLNFKRQSDKKLKSLTNMDVIGITGSYGKTSTKNVVNDILSEKYIVFKTPQNYNTAYGLINTVNNYLDKYNDYFIAEMGTLKKNDIKTEADIVKPKYGILTKIGMAHLEAFGSIENIAKEKFDLIEKLPSDGVAILNKDDEYQVNYEIKNDCKKVWYGIDNKADVTACDIKYFSDGMSFNVLIDGKKYPFKTKLLGSANVYNILAGIALSLELGLKIEQIQKGVSKIMPVEHRLELKSYGKLNYIDDAYNSNPVGSKMALDVLKLMPGKKIVITPGMIEMGDKQYEINYNFGKYIAESVDLAILVGKEQTKPIYDGIIDSKFDKDKVLVFNDVKDAINKAKTYFDEEVYILLENDLPDIFNEK